MISKLELFHLGFVPPKRLLCQMVIVFGRQILPEPQLRN